MTATALSFTSTSERYREVTLTANSAGELLDELARYRVGQWQLAAVFHSCSTKAGGVKVTLLLEHIHTLSADTGIEQAGAAVS